MQTPRWLRLLLFSTFLAFNQGALAQNKPFDGVTVRVGTQASQWADAFKQYAPDFTKETGITLEFDDISFDVMYEKLKTGFIGGAFSYDMI
jgi:ABC-type glycerol-3-phosphate transport system substrate-binding protein